MIDRFVFRLCGQITCPLPALKSGLGGITLLVVTPEGLLDEGAVLQVGGITTGHPLKFGGEGGHGVKIKGKI